jgi:hypothetical protein
MIMKTAACAAALLLAACTTPAATPPAADTLGPDGWGPLRIGMAADEVATALGATAAPRPPRGRTAECAEYHPAGAPPGLMVMMEQGRLTRISLTGTATIKTDANLGLGAEPGAVKGTYGAGVRSTPAKYDPAPAEDITIWTRGAGTEGYVENPDARGLRYQVGPSGKVEAIRAGGPSIQYVEGCG